MTGFPIYKHTLQAHTQFFIHQYPQVLLCRATLNHFIIHSMLMLGIAVIQVQDFLLDFVGLHEVYIGTVITPVKVALDGIPSQ